MSKQTKHSELATRIRDAYAGTPIAPIRSQLAELDIDAAYAIQQQNTAHWRADAFEATIPGLGTVSARFATA